MVTKAALPMCSFRTWIHGHDENGKQSGAAYVFVRDGDIWNQQVKLSPPDGSAHDWFGHSVAISNQTIVIGSYFDDDNGPDSGSVYVFVLDGDLWSQQSKLLPYDGNKSDKFGKSVSVSADTIVIGAFHDDHDNGDDSGSAYVFTRNMAAWTQHAKLSPSSGQAGDNFGRAVSVSGDNIVIGTSQVTDNSNSTGTAYVFIRDGNSWNQKAWLFTSYGQDFGSSVAVSGDTVVVGDDDNSDKGSVHVFTSDSAGK